MLFTACDLGLAHGQAVQGTGTGDPITSQVFRSDAGSTRTMANGGRSRDILHVTLATGEAVAVHESAQAAGIKPNPLHAIQHSELFLVREGTLAFVHDGREETAGPGDMIYVAYGTQHTVRNVGNGTAKYIVIALGGDVKK